MNRATTILNSVWWIRIAGDTRKVLVKDLVTKDITQSVPYVQVFDYSHWEDKEHLLEHVEWLKRSQDPD